MKLLRQSGSELSNMTIIQHDVIRDWMLDIGLCNLDVGCGICDNGYRNLELVPKFRD